MLPDHGSIYENNALLLGLAMRSTILLLLFSAIPVPDMVHPFSAARQALQYNLTIQFMHGLRNTCELLA